MRRRTPLIILGMAALLAGFVAAPSSAQESGSAVLLILDASGSMNRVDDNGVKLIEGAQEALVRLVESIPEGAIVGLRVYGHRVPNTDKRNGCKDTELIVPPGPLDHAQMVEAIRSFSAKGFTPIGRSLQEAAADLEPVGGGTIVLVSDGEDTCAPPPPCEVASDLIAQGFRIQVHTVGFFLEADSGARDELQCIAGATGGTYGEVDSVDYLTTEVGNIVRRALPEGENFHLPIEGSLVRSEAPLLDLLPPAPESAPESRYEGFFSGTVRPGETRWYAVEVHEEEDVGVGVALWPEAYPDVVDPDAFEVLIVDEGGNDVRVQRPTRDPSRLDLASATSPEGSLGLSASTAVEVFLWEHLYPEERANAERQGFTQESYEAWARETFSGVPVGPPDPGTYYVGFLWDSARPADARLAFDFSIDLIHVDYTEFHGEPPRLLAGGAMLNEATDLPLQPFDAFPFAGSENDPVLEGRFTAAIRAGETLWYRSELGWDEAMSVGAFLHRPLETPTATGETFALHIYGPDAFRLGLEAAELNPGVTGAIIPLDDDSLLRHDEPQWLPRPEAKATTEYLGDAYPPIQGLEGTHYLAITWGSTIGDYEAEAEFVVDIIRTCRTGCSPREQILATTAAPRPTVPETSAAPQVPATPPPSEPAAAPAATDNGGDGGALIWLVGAALLIGLALGAWVGRRRRVG